MLPVLSLITSSQQMRTFPRWKNTTAAGAGLCPSMVMACETDAAAPRLKQILLARCFLFPSVGAVSVVTTERKDLIRSCCSLQIGFHATHIYIFFPFWLLCSWTSEANWPCSVDLSYHSHDGSVPPLRYEPLHEHHHIYQLLTNKLNSRFGK